MILDISPATANQVTRFTLKCSFTLLTKSLYKPRYVLHLSSTLVVICLHFRKLHILPCLLVVRHTQAEYISIWLLLSNLDRCWTVTSSNVLKFFTFFFFNFSSYNNSDLEQYSLLTLKREEWPGRFLVFFIQILLFFARWIVKRIFFSNQ